MCKNQLVVCVSPTGPTGSVVIKGSDPGRCLQAPRASVMRRKSEELSQNGMEPQRLHASIDGRAYLLLAVENPKQVGQDDEIYEQQAQPHPGTMTDKFV